MVGTIVGGICPGVEELFKELNRSGLMLLNFNENIQDLSQMLESSLSNVRKEIIKIAQRESVQKILVIGNDDALRLAYSFCSVGMNVAYVPSADSSITCRGLGIHTVLNYLMRMLVLTKEVHPQRLVTVLLPRSLGKVLERFGFLFNACTIENSFSLKLPGVGDTCIVQLQKFLNCLTVEEQDKVCYLKVARKLVQVFTHESKICHAFSCDDDPVPISKVYELLKKVKVDEREPSIRKVGDQEY
ncbi:hypothetical protein [Pseudothermotoga sp.]|uniref:hypothetical protein n=1 Tax=Pseudothermotoga sp. TaxID=2033661 RepID=UPI0031F67C62